jgi:hypothetical protein
MYYFLGHESICLKLENDTTVAGNFANFAFFPFIFNQEKRAQQF